MRVFHMALCSMTAPCGGSEVDAARCAQVPTGDSRASTAHCRSIRPARTQPSAQREVGT